MPRKKKADVECVDVTVWDHEGNIVKKAWEATWDEADAIEDQYSDDPLKTVIIERRD